MTKVIYLSLGISAAASLVILGSQYQKNSELKAKTEQLKSSLATDTSETIQAKPSPPPPALTEGPSIRPQAIASAEKQLQDFIEGSNNMNQDIAVALKGVPHILELVGELHPEELLEVFHKLSSSSARSTNNRFTSIVIGSLLAESDPLCVLNDTDTNNDALNKLRSNALNSLMLRDPAAGLKWYRSNKQKLEQLNPHRRTRVNNVVSLNLMRSTPHKCIDFLSELPASDLRRSTEWIETYRMDSSTRSQLISALDTHKNPQLNENIAQALYRSALATKDEKIFSQTLKGISLTPEQRHATLIEATDHVLAHSRGNYQAVVDFINTVSSVQDRPQVMKGAMESWAYRDTKAAGEWLQELDPSPTKDATMAGYAQTVVKADPEAAMEWLDQISDPTTRKQATQDVMKAWEKHDADAAQKWKEARVTP